MVNMRTYRVNPNGQGRTRTSRRYCLVIVFMISGSPDVKCRVTLNLTLDPVVVIVSACRLAKANRKDEKGES